MKELDEYRQQAQTKRTDLFRMEEALDRHRNLLRHRQDQLNSSFQQGNTETQEAALIHEIQALEAEIERDNATIRALKNPPAQLLAPPLTTEPWQLVEGLHDDLPFLLLPIRIETRFIDVNGQKQIWVRLYPDVMSVDTHEKNLTKDEVQAGEIYWREIWRARHASGEDQAKAIEKDARRALATKAGPRAVWIAQQTQPASLDVAKVEQLQFPQFTEESLKAESWSQAPCSKVMPDCFVVMGFLDGKEVFRKAGNPIPDPLIVGPAPQ